jgi:hypothetical protein
MAEQRAVNSKVRGSSPRGRAEGAGMGKEWACTLLNNKGKNCLLKN